MQSFQLVVASLVNQEVPMIRYLAKIPIPVGFQIENG